MATDTFPDGLDGPRAACAFQQADYGSYNRPGTTDRGGTDPLGSDPVTDANTAHSTGGATKDTRPATKYNDAGV